MERKEIEGFFKQTDTLIALLLGKTKAMELALASVIASHPDPAKALAIWDRVHWDLADEAFDARTFAGYQEQMARSLEMWTRGFRAAKGIDPNQ